MEPTSGPFVVMKFGGTSVSSPTCWQTIAQELGKRFDAGEKPVVVCSALAGSTDLLEQLLAAAMRSEHEPVIAEIRGAHKELGDKLGIDTAAAIDEELADLARLATGASLTRDVSPRLRARTLAYGELLATRLGAAYLARAGVPVSWVDVRDHLTAQVGGAHESESRRWFCASVDDAPDATLARTLGQLEGAVITQGFIAADRWGDTVLLGRGGSDTTAATLAARIGARRCEIWTDVPGVFSAHPHMIPGARLLRFLDYDEAQEIASMGSKVLHPRCVAPCRRHHIPLHIRWTERPDVLGTEVARDPSRGEAQVKAITHKSGVTLVSMDTPGMWQQVGFLADAFACFKARGLSIDLVSTSEMTVTVSLDPGANPLDDETLDGLVKDLAPFCRARIIGRCTAVSLVGRRIRAALHQLGPALSAFEEKRIHLVTQAASDLNFTFVVDEGEAERLLRELHGLLFSERPAETFLGPTWRDLFEGRATGESYTPATTWWQTRRAELLELADRTTPLYVYDQATLRSAAAAARGIDGVERVLYALKANANPGVLQTFEAAGINFECVSAGELAHLFHLFPGLDPARVLFTPNFAPRDEYADALERGVTVTVDSLHPLSAWPELFGGRSIFVRLDPGRGRGHHDHVRTAGPRSKFGIARSDLDEFLALTRTAGATVTGLHAHVGSGILAPETWGETALFLAQVAESIPSVKVLDLGGGLGVVEKPGQSPLDLQAISSTLAKIQSTRPDLELWLEPGRYLVAQAGVLLGRVTQLKRKGELEFIGTDVGLNSLVRPALYGSYHEIVNLSRLDKPRTTTAHIVGPICESGDVLGYARTVAPTQEGDVLLFATAGAYGRVMSSSYNMREPAQEAFLAE